MCGSYAIFFHFFSSTFAQIFQFFFQLFLWLGLDIRENCYCAEVVQLFFHFFLKFFSTFDQAFFQLFLWLGQDIRENCYCAEVMQCTSHLPPPAISFHCDDDGNETETLCKLSVFQPFPFCQSKENGGKLKVGKQFWCQFCMAKMIFITFPFQWIYHRKSKYFDPDFALCVILISYSYVIVRHD